MRDELIARLEAATEGSRELSDDVLVACGWRKTTTGNFYSPAGHYNIGERPRPTTSLDAALTLVPDGWYFSTSNGRGMPARPHISAQVYRGSYRDYDGKGATLSLSLCIAALKARKAGDTNA